MGLFDFLAAPKQDDPKVLYRKGKLTPEGEEFANQAPPDDFTLPQPSRRRKPLRALRRRRHPPRLRPRTSKPRSTRRT